MKPDNVSILDIIVVFSSSSSYLSASLFRSLPQEPQSLHHFPSPNPVSINFLPMFTSLTSGFSFLLHFMESQSSENKLTLRFQALLSKLVWMFGFGCMLSSTDAAPMSQVLKFTGFWRFLSAFLRKPETSGKQLKREKRWVWCLVWGKPYGDLLCNIINVTFQISHHVIISSCWYIVSPTENIDLTHIYQCKCLFYLFVLYFSISWTLRWIMRCRLMVFGQCISYNSSSYTFTVRAHEFN